MQKDMNIEHGIDVVNNPTADNFLIEVSKDT